jgi:hypothetical protein
VHYKLTKNRCAPEPPKPPKFLFQQWPFAFEVQFIIINSGTLDADAFLSEKEDFAIFVLYHFQNAPLSGYRLLLVTLKRISFSEA